MKLTPAVAALATATALVLVPSAANAETKAHTDTTGDVYMSPESDDTGENFTKDPTRVEGDIAAIRVSHRAANVQVTLRYRELSRVGFANFDYFRIRSDKSVRSVQVFGVSGHWRGEAVMQNARGRKVTCALRHTIDYANNKVIVIIPRSCLGNPRWVRIGAIGGSLDQDGNTYADDARSSGIGDNPVLGPRVHRA